MECPKCGLLNPKRAMRCDCGYDFAARTVKRSYLASQKSGAAHKEVDVALDPRVSASKSIPATRVCSKCKRPSAICVGMSQTRINFIPSGVTARYACGECGYKFRVAPVFWSAVGAFMVVIPVLMPSYRDGDAVPLDYRIPFAMLLVLFVASLVHEVYVRVKNPPVDDRDRYS